MKVLLFARTRDLAGVAEIDLELPAGSRVADLRRVLGARIPQLAAFLPHCAVAINDEYAADDSVLAETDRVALLPPVSGG